MEWQPFSPQPSVSHSPKVPDNQHYGCCQSYGCCQLRGSAGSHGVLLRCLFLTPDNAARHDRLLEANFHGGAGARGYASTSRASVSFH